MRQSSRSRPRDGTPTRALLALPVTALFGYLGEREDIAGSLQRVWEAPDAEAAHTHAGGPPPIPSVCSAPSS